MREDKHEALSNRLQHLREVTLDFCVKRRWRTTIYIYTHTQPTWPQIVATLQEAFAAEQKNMNIKSKRHDATVLVRYDYMYIFSI